MGLVTLPWLRAIALSRVMVHLASEHLCQVHRIEYNDSVHEAFLREYHEKQPVILRNATTEWEAHVSWDRDTFVQEYGDQIVKLEKQIAYGKKVFAGYLKIHDFMAAERQDSIGLSFRLYEFHRAMCGKITPIPLPFHDIMAEPVFSLGRRGTGADMHFHDQTWLAQIRGRKQWLLMEPNAKSPFTKGGEHPCEVASRLENFAQKVGREAAHRIAKVHVCEVGPGETLYLPQRWHHATCNLDDFTLGVGGRDVSTPAHLACTCCDMSALKNSFDSDEIGQSPDALDGLHQTPLLVCMQSACFEGVEFLLARGATDVESREARRPSLIAASSGHTSLLEAFAAANFSLDLPNREGLTPFEAATRSGHVEAADLLKKMFHANEAMQSWRVDL